MKNFNHREKCLMNCFVLFVYLFFKLRERLPFCSEYKEWSCCDEKEALSIQKTVNELMRKECPSCYRMIAEWKCAQCHPRAGNQLLTISLFRY
jgi:hypothetical protein